MQKNVILTSAAALVLLAGCEKAEAPAPAPTDATTTDVSAGGAPVAAADPAAGHRFASWAGRWLGVEGMYAAITLAGPGKYELEMQSDLDTKGTYEGKDSEDGIRFTRGTEELSLRRGSGEETGLKYLAGKKDCLIVKQGEGYCRD